MNKKDRKTINETIRDILKIRKYELGKIVVSFNPKLGDNAYNRKFEKKVLEEKKELIKKFDLPLIKLNNLLKQKDKSRAVLDIEKQMRKIQSKKNITVKEFAEIYNISKTSQQNYRGRIHDSLPYHQKVEGGKIVYVVKEVEEWFENQHK